MKKLNLKQDIGLNLWFVFFAVIAGAYIFLNKPLYHVALNLRPIGFALVFVLAFTGLGAPLADLLYRHKSRTDHFLASFAIGTGLTGLSVFILGIMGIIDTMVYALWTLAGLVLFVITLLRRWMPLEMPSFFNRGNSLDILALVIIIPFILQALPNLASPVVSVDALEYHLLIPRIFLNTGQISYIPGLVESNYPLLFEYIYLLVMPLAGDVACKSLHFFTGIFLLVTMGRIITKTAPGTGRLLGPALFLSMPVAITAMGWAWNDAAFAFFMLLAVSYFLDYHDSEETDRRVRSLLMAGIAAGLAVWTKYTFVMILAALLPLFLAAIIRWRWKWKHLLWFFVPLGLISLLVFIKNYVFTGNPFYPFLNNIFHSPFWNEAASNYFKATLTRFENPDWNWTHYFLFPFKLTLVPRIIDVHTGIIPLAAAPLLFFRSPNRKIEFLKWFIVSYVSMWLLFQTLTRSLLVMLALLFCVAVVLLEQKVWSRPAYRRPLVFLLAVAMLANLGIVLVSNYYLTKPVDYFLGLEKKEQFLRREAGSYQVYEWLNKTPSVGKVLLVGLYGPYYLKRYPYFTSLADPPIAEVLTRGIQTDEQLKQRFGQLGITHVAINKDNYHKENREGLYSWPPEQRQVFETFMNRHCKGAAKFGKDFIYRLK